MIPKMCIYVISSVNTEHIYIGSAVNFNIRKGQHLYCLKNNKHHSKILQNHFNKYGASDLVFNIIEHINDKLVLISREQFFINLLAPEFNVRKVAGSNIGFKHTEEWKINKSKIMKGQKYALGHKLSEEMKKHLSVFRKKLKHSDESKAKISRKNKGRIRSAYTREKQRLSALGKPKSEAHKMNMKGNTNGSNKGTVIIQFTEKNIFIREWTKIREASIALNIKAPNISHCIANKRNFAGGFKWKRKEYCDFLLQHIDI
jgi:group I intron endonuclease